MATVYHPTFDDVSYDVPDADADEWTNLGWRKTPISSTGQTKRKPRKRAARKPAKAPLKHAGSPDVEVAPTEVDPERTPA